MAYEKDGKHYTGISLPTTGMPDVAYKLVKPSQEELDKIMVVENICADGVADCKQCTKIINEWKSAINSLTLKQVMSLIGPDEEIKPWISDAGGIRNIYRQSLRESAERIWKI